MKKALSFLDFLAIYCNILIEQYQYLYWILENSSININIGNLIDLYLCCDTLMKEIVLAVFSFVERYRLETCSFPFQFYPCNMASMVYNSWTKIKKPKLYSLYHMVHIIWSIWYGPYDMDHIIWSFMDYEKYHITWAILYGPILYRFINRRSPQS